MQPSEGWASGGKGRDVEDRGAPCSGRPLLSVEDKTKTRTHIDGPKPRRRAPNACLHTRMQTRAYIWTHHGPIASPHTAPAKSPLFSHVDPRVSCTHLNERARNATSVPAHMRSIESTSPRASRRYAPVAGSLVRAQDRTKEQSCAARQHRASVSCDA